MPQSNKTHAERLTAFQYDMLDLIKKYHEQGVNYDDILTLTFNIASIVAINENISLERSTGVFETIYKIAAADALPVQVN